MLLVFSQKARMTDSLFVICVRFIRKRYWSHKIDAHDAAKNRDYISFGVAMTENNLSEYDITLIAAQAGWHELIQSEKYPPETLFLYAIQGGQVEYARKYEYCTRSKKYWKTHLVMIMGEAAASGSLEAMKYIANLYNSVTKRIWILNLESLDIYTIKENIRTAAQMLYFIQLIDQYHPYEDVDYWNYSLQPSQITWEYALYLHKTRGRHPSKTIIWAIMYDDIDFVRQIPPEYRPREWPYWGYRRFSNIEMLKIYIEWYNVDLEEIIVEAILISSPEAISWLRLCHGVSWEKILATVDSIIINHKNIPFQPKYYKSQKYYIHFKQLIEKSIKLGI